MQQRTVGLFSYPWQNNLTIPRKPSRNPVYMYRWAVWFKANPRNEDYMRALFFDRYPEGEFINVDKNEEWRKTLMKANTVVLLFPDAIGLGFAQLEKEVKQLKKKGVPIRALNGRRRDFLLNNAALFGLKTRRLIERWMIGEVIALIIFICITPLFLAVDWLRGRR